MIAIFDYGAGNLRSVQNTLAEIGATYTLVRDADGLRAASKIILPGVGHFGQMMRALDALEVREALLERIRAGVPFLGICLGLQALFESSEEAPEVRGLGLYPGTVRRFPLDARVPHMGWNQLEPCKRRSSCWRTSAPQPYVYFAHSYYVPVDRRDGRPLHLHACPIPRCSNRATSSACSSIPRNRGPWDCGSCGISWSSACWPSESFPVSTSPAAAW